MKYKQIWKTAASCLVAALMFPSCSDDEGGGGDVQDGRYRTLMITLNSLGNQEVGTRAESEDDVIDPDHPDSFDEHYISRYWLLILKQDAEGEFKVDRVIDSNDPEDNVSRPNNSHPNSETELGVEVEIGQTYRFYALANLDGLANGDEVIAALDALESGDSFDPTKILDATEENKVLYASVKEMSKYPKDGQSYIPMTSYGYDETITSSTTRLTDDEGKPESIALIRLVGKATVSIDNLTGKEVKLSSLTMQPMRKGDIFLFPYDVAADTRYLLDEKMSEIYPPEFGESEGEPYDIEFVENEVSIPANTKKEDIVYSYLPETSWDDNADLTVTSKVTDRNPYPQSIHTSFVRRNDWIRIPMQITPITAEFTVKQEHMPIGGIPAEIEFPAYKVNIPIISCTTDHAGKVTITYTIKDEENLFTSPTISYRPAEGYDPTAEYTHATILKNENDVLYELKEGDEIYLSGDGTLTGTLELTVQELANTSSAQVQLLIVIAESGETGPDSKRLAIPYTINLTYKNKEN